MSYDYSPAHRAVEIVSIIVFAILEVLLIVQVVRGVQEVSSDDPVVGWWLVPTFLLAAWLTADFVSGCVHFLADRFGSEETPLVGANLVRPFREHHVDPRAITRHDFIETNGNNCFVCVPTQFGVYWFTPTAAVWGVWILGFTAVFMVTILMTNQFHKWAHLEDPPKGLVGWLQRYRLILSPGHHDIHHTPPFTNYYCITTGWLNPVLARLHFFPLMESLLIWLGLPHIDQQQPQPAAPEHATSS